MARFDVAARFAEKVDRRGPDECWEWTACRTRTGYGSFGMCGRVYSAHRAAFLLHHGREAAGCVLHRCDNRSCVNPAHLFEGTQAENIQDMDSKRRRARGAALRRNKLTESDVPVIRALYRWSGFLNREIAAEYGVAVNTISAITAGTSWAHV